MLKLKINSEDAHFKVGGIYQDGMSTWLCIEGSNEELMLTSLEDFSSVSAMNQSFDEYAFIGMLELKFDLKNKE